MAKLEDISIDVLHEPHEDVDDSKASKELMLAILYKQTPSVQMIAGWADIRNETICRWCTELEDEPLQAAIFERHRQATRRN